MKRLIVVSILSCNMTFSSKTYIRNILKRILKIFIRSSVNVRYFPENLNEYREYFSESVK